MISLSLALPSESRRPRRHLVRRAPRARRRHNERRRGGVGWVGCGRVSSDEGEAGLGQWQGGGNLGCVAGACQPPPLMFTLSRPCRFGLCQPPERVTLWEGHGGIRRRGDGLRGKTGAPTPPSPPLPSSPLPAISETGVQTTQRGYV